MTREDTDPDVLPTRDEAVRVAALTGSVKMRAAGRTVDALIARGWLRVADSVISNVTRVRDETL